MCKQQDAKDDNWPNTDSSHETSTDNFNSRHVKHTVHKEGNHQSVLVKEGKGNLKETALECSKTLASVKQLTLHSDDRHGIQMSL